MFYRPLKKPVTMRLDADVIHWLKQEGPGYQTKANALLREAMIRSLDGTQRSQESELQPIRTNKSKRLRKAG